MFIIPVLSTINASSLGGLFAAFFCLSICLSFYLSIFLSVCLFLSLSPTSIYNLSVKFSGPSFLSIYPRNFNCPFLILSVLLVSIFPKTSSLLTCSVNEFLGILLQNKNSVALSLLFICEQNAQYTLTYMRSEIITFQYSFLFSNEIFLFLNTLLSFGKGSFTIPMRLRIRCHVFCLILKHFLDI